MTILRILVAAAGCALALTGAAGADGGQVLGSVGPGFTISLSSASGGAVSRLDPGSYTLVVNDQSEEHNFHLQGPGGVDVLTGVSDVGTKTFDLMLVAGTYTFVCDPHASRMRGSFAVGGAGAGSGTGGGTPAPAPQRLTLTVTAKAATLTTAAGAAVTALRAGPAVLTLKDFSAKRGVKLAGAGAVAATTAPFVGTRAWKGTLRAGTLVVSSAGLKPLRVRVS